MSRRLPFAALVLAVLLAGCGDGGEDAAGSRPDPSSDTASPTVATDVDAPGGSTATEQSDTAAEDGLADACTLLDSAELAPVVGEVEPEADSGTAIDMLEFSQCVWSTEDAMVVVAVVDGPARYEMHRDDLPSEPVDGVGDEAVTMPGVSSETTGATGGRTVSALVDGRTLVVALRVEGQTTLDLVRPLAEAAVGRLG